MQLKTLEKETGSPDEDHFITVDAVGCFESGQEKDEDDDEEEEGGGEIEAEEEFCKQVCGVGCWWLLEPRYHAGIYRH